MKYVSAVILLVVAAFILEGAWFMWPKREHHPDDWLACAMLPAMLGVVGLLTLFAAGTVLL